MERFDFIQKWGTIRNNLNLVASQTDPLTADNTFMLAAKLYAIRSALEFTEVKAIDSTVLPALLKLPPFAYEIKDSTFPRRYVREYISKLTDTYFDGDDVFETLDHLIDSAEKAYQTVVEFKPENKDDELQKTDWSFRPMNQDLTQAMKKHARNFLIGATVLAIAVGAVLLYAQIQDLQLLRTMAAITGIMLTVGIYTAAKRLDTLSERIKPELERNMTISTFTEHNQRILRFGDSIQGVKHENMLKEDVAQRFTAPAINSR